MCPTNEQLHSYADGELDAAGRVAVERHLANCAACESQLRAIEDLSRLFRASEPPALSQIALHRLHLRTQNVMEESLVRLARRLSAVAACILVGASVWLMSLRMGHSDPVRSAVVTTPPASATVVDLDSAVASADTATPVELWSLRAPPSREDDSQ